MRIAIVTATYRPMVNGVAVFSHNLALGLTRRGEDVIVICPSQTNRARTEIIDGVKVYYLKSVPIKIYPDQIHPALKKRRTPFYKHSLRISLLPRRAVSKILSEFSPDVVHVQVSDPVGLAAVSYAKKHGLPVVTTEHSQPDVFTVHLPRLLKRPADAAFTRYVVGRQEKSDFATMPTEKAIRDMTLCRRREFKIPIAAVSNGVDLSNFRPGKAPEAIYRKYKLNKVSKTLLSLGRLDPEKRVDLVIRAYLQAKPEMRNTQLVIVGDGSDKMRLMKLAKGHDGIHFLGRVTPPELYDVYRLGDIFVTASEIETQGIVLIEAAACGMPLIAVDKGAVSEICRDGENGRLCRPGDVNGIAAAMVEITADQNLRSKFTERSLEIAREHDIERTLDKFINIYHKVIDGIDKCNKK